MKEVKNYQVKIQHNKKINIDITVVNSNLRSDVSRKIISSDYEIEEVYL